MSAVKKAESESPSAMTRSEFLRMVAQRHPEWPMTETTRLANLVFDEIARQLGEGGNVEIRGFGTFISRRLNARIARDPRTGETLEILARRIPRFRAGTTLRAKVERAGAAEAREDEDDDGGGTAEAKSAS